jgi:hypothetical protein
VVGVKEDWSQSNLKIRPNEDMWRGPLECTSIAFLIRQVFRAAHHSRNSDIPPSPTVGWPTGGGDRNVGDGGVGGAMLS